MHSDVDTGRNPDLSMNGYAEEASRANQVRQSLECDAVHSEVFCAGDEGAHTGLSAAA